MRKHHYELIAKAMRSVRPTNCAHRDYRAAGAREQWGRDCHFLASALEAQDPNFNRELFLKECVG